MKISAEIRGVEKLWREFERRGVKAQKGIDKALSRAALKVSGDAKRKAPVDSGLLRASIHITPAIRTGDKLVAKVGTNVEYAPYVEFGTGFRGSVSNNNTIVPITHATDWAGRFAHPFLYPALHENKDAIRKIFAGEIKEK